MSILTTGLLTSFNVLADRLPEGDGELYNARKLADMGVERDSAEQGFIAYAWNLIRATFGASPEEKEYRRAVRELRAYSDAELADIGVPRYAIAYMVRHGRPGIDRPVSKAA